MILNGAEQTVLARWLVYNRPKDQERHPETTDEQELLVCRRSTALHVTLQYQSAPPVELIQLLCVRLQLVHPTAVPAGIGDPTGMTPIHIAAVNGVSNAILQYLLENTAGWIGLSRDVRGKTPLHYAAGYRPTTLKLHLLKWRSQTENAFRNVQTLVQYCPQAKRMRDEDFRTPCQVANGREGKTDLRILEILASSSSSSTRRDRDSLFFTRGNSSSQFSSFSALSPTVPGSVAAHICWDVDHDDVSSLGSPTVRYTTVDG